MTKIFHTVFSLFLLYFLSGCSSSSNSEETEKIDGNKTEKEETPKQDPIITSPNNNQPDVKEPISENEIKRTLKYLYISGIAIDGYIYGGSVKLNGIGDDKNSIKSIKSSINGNWSFQFESNKTEDEQNFVVDVSGGIDTATGEPFEGVLSAILETDEIIQLEENESIADKEDEVLQKRSVVTPLTTIIKAMVENSSFEKGAKNRAELNFAKKLGVSKKSFKDDLIEKSKNGTVEEKAEAIKLHKDAITIQKVAEIMSKSIANKDDEDLKFNKIFSSIISSISKEMDNNSSDNFTDIIINSIDKIAENSILDLKSSNTNSNIEIKLLSSIKSSKKIISLISKVESDNVKYISQATELVSIKIEENLENVAKLDIGDENELNSTILQISNKAEAVANAVIIVGGIDKIAKEIKKAVNSTDSDTNKTISIYNFSDMLSDEVVKQKSNIYNILIDNNLSENTILDASIKFANSETNSSLIDIAIEIEQNKEDNSTISFENLKNLDDYIINLLNESDKTFENSINGILNIQDKNISTVIIEDSNNSEINSSNNTVDTNISTESNNSETESGTDNANTSTTPTAIFYLNRWWTIERYNQLMSIMGEAPPPAMTDANIISTRTPENPTTTISDSMSVDNNFSTVDDAENILRDFANINNSDLEWLNSLVLSQDFDSVNMLLALMMDFSRQDENLTTLKTLVFNADFDGKTDLEKLTELVFALDFSVQDTNLDNLKNLIFSQDFENQVDIAKLKEIIFALDFAQQNSNLETLKDLILDNNFMAQTNLEALKTLLFSEDFVVQQDLDKLINLIFELDFALQDENLAKLKELVFTSDFENQTDLSKLTDMIFTLNFKNQNVNLSSLKDLIYLANFKTKEDLDKLSEIIFAIDFSNQSNTLDILKDIIFALDFSAQNNTQSKLIDLVFNLDFLDNKDENLDKLTDILFAIDFSKQSDELLALKDMIFSNDFENYNQKQETLKELILTLDFSKKDENLDNLKDIIFASNFRTDFNSTNFNLTDIIFSLDIKKKDENLETLKSIILDSNFKTDFNVTDIYMKDILFSLDFNQKDENLVTLKDIIFAKDTLNEFNTTLAKIQSLIFSLDFENRVYTFNTLKDIVINSTLIDRPDEMSKILSILFSLSFPTQDIYLVTMKDLIFESHLIDYDSDQDALKDIIYNLDDLNFSNGTGVNTTFINGDWNTTQIYSDNTYDIPKMIDYFPYFEKSVTFSQMYSWCRYTIYDYNIALALDCLDDSIEDTLHYEFKRIGYID